MRTCGECTECCTGTLQGEVRGYKFDKNSPCFFLKENKCSIYESRPDHPCKNYSCMWLNDISIPDFMRPDISKVVLTKRSVDNFDYIEAEEAARKIMSAETLANVINFAVQTKQNLVYRVSGRLRWFGDPEFINFMDNQKIVTKIIEVKPYEA